MNGVEFCEASRTLGYNFYTGVPDSTLGSIFAVLENDQQYNYLLAPREDNAIGLAAGAYFGGLRPMVLMQNSGIGHCLTALASLASMYRIPLLLTIGWRGHDGSDAPEHRMLGNLLPALLRLMEIQFLAPEPADVHKSLIQLSDLSCSRSAITALLLRDKVVQ